MATASWRPCRGDDGMRPPKFRPSWSTGIWVMAFQTFFNMAAVRHLELEFCHSRPPTKSTMLFGCPVKIWCRSDFCRRRYCDFMILLVWLLMLNHTSFLGVLIPENCGLPSTPQKAHPWVKTRYLSHKRLNPSKGSSWGRSSRLPAKRIDGGHDWLDRWHKWLSRLEGIND